jgi:hypothetical protein
MTVLYEPLLDTCTVNEPAVEPFWSIPLSVLINVELAVLVAVGDCMFELQAASACATVVAEGAKT